MPLYGYQCDTCGHRFEVRQGIREDALTVCPQCGSPIRRIIYPVGIVFKGSGFYVNDSRNSSSTAKPATNGDGATGDTGDKDKGNKKDGAAETAATSDKGPAVAASAGDGAKSTSSTTKSASSTTKSASSSSTTSSSSTNSGSGSATS